LQKKETSVGNFSVMHWIVVAVVALVLFGRGRISETMGDFGKGIKSFRKGMTEVDDEPATAQSPATTPALTQQVAPAPVTRVEQP